MLMYPKNIFSTKHLTRQKRPGKKETKSDCREIDTNQNDCYIKVKKLEFTDQHIPVPVTLHQIFTTDSSAKKRLVEEDPNNLIGKFEVYMMALSLKINRHQREISFGTN